MPCLGYFFRKAVLAAAMALVESLRTETDYARLYGVKLTFDIQAR